MEHVNRVFALDTFDINDEEINVEEIMQKIRENIKKRKESGEYPENNASRLSRQSESYEYLYGWHNAENWDGVPTRWMGDEAILMINSNCLKKANLSFRAISFHHDRNLKISDEQGQDILQAVSTDPTIISIFINLKEGPNTIRFTIPEGGERPCDIPELSSDDSRCLSIAIQSISVQDCSENERDIFASSSNIEPMVFTPEALYISTMNRHLREIDSKWDIQNNSYNISSHRLVTGKLLVKGRELVHGEVVRYVDPLIMKQKNFNYCAVECFKDTIQKIDILAKKLIEIGEANNQAKNNIYGQIDNIFSNTNEKIEKCITQAKADVLVEADSRIGNANTAISQNLSDLLSQTRSEISGEIQDKIAQAKADVLVEADSRIGNANTAISQNLSDLLSQTRSEISGEIQDKIAQAKADVLVEADSRIGNANTAISQNLSDLLSQTRSEISGEIQDKIAQAKADIGKDTAANISELRSEIDRRIDEHINDAVAALNDDLDKKAWLAGVLEQRLDKVKDLSVSLKSNDPGINYFVFEERFRGPRAAIKQRQSAFLEYFEGCKNVLDIGCGRGEFLELLRENGIEAEGADMDEDMVKYCTSKGLKVTRADAISFLEGLEDKSLDGIFLDQVVEHLEPAYLVKMLELCYKKLNYGYNIVVETVNPLSLTSFANFYIDMTHKRPMHPETLRYLLASVNFRDLDTKFFSPVPDDQRLKRLHIENGSNIENDIKEVYNYNVNLLNNILYGSQDYMICGKK